MPVVPFIPAIVSAGTAIYSASQQRQAAGRALDAQTAANDRALAEQAASRAQVERLQTPTLNAGNAALQQLAAESGLGVTPGGLPPGRVAYPTTATAPTAQGGGGKTPGGFAGTSPMDNLPAGGNPTLSVSGRPAQAPQQMVDGAGYLQANPDIADFWNALPPEEQARRGGVDQFALAHYQSSGQAEGRALPSTTYQSDPGMTFTRPDAAPTPTFQRPDAAPAPNLQRPDAAPPPEFTRPTMARPDQPTFNDPGDFGSFSFDASKIAEDPGYQFRLDQGMRSLNTGFGARGLLRSGGAMKGALDYSQGLASQETANAFARQMAAYQANLGTNQANRTTGYNIFATDRNNLNDNFESDRANLDTNFNTDRSYGTNLWADQRDFANTNFNSDRGFAEDRYRYGVNRADENFDRDRGFDAEMWRYNTERRNRDFESDRGYATSRQDVRTGNLFDLAQMGTGAAASVGGAAQTYANNASSIFGSQAQAAADAAYQRAGANAGAVGTIAGAATNIFNNYVPRSSSTPTSSVGTVNYGSSLNNVYAPRRVF